MTANFAFEGAKEFSESAEPIHVFIPLAKDADAGNYQILAGFQLTEEQIAEARAHQDAKIERVSVQTSRSALSVSIEQEKSLAVTPA